MPAQTIAPQVLVQNESYEPIANTDVEAYDLSTKALLAVATTKLNGIATFTAFTLPSGVKYGFRPRATRLSGGGGGGFTSKSLNGAVHITPLPVPVNSTTVPWIVFLNKPKQITASVQTDNYTIQRQDDNGTPITEGAQSVYLYSTEPTGTFAPASPITIADGASTATFKYTDSVGGDPVITASPFALI